MTAAPTPQPEHPAPEVDVLREQVAELTKAAQPWNGFCGHASHPTMGQLAEQIADKVNWRGEALHHREVIERVRQVHRCDDDGNCVGCGTDAYEEPIRWADCETTRALDPPVLTGQPQGLSLRTTEPGPWVSSRYGDECGNCGDPILPGEPVRASGDGGWQGQCCGDET